MRNFRDFGVSKVKKGVFYRGESLHRLSKSDAKHIFRDCGVKVVIDLRTAQERKTKKDKVVSGVIYEHLPLVTMEEMGAKSEIEGKLQVIKTHQLPDIHHYYRRLIAIERKESWTRIFEWLLNLEEGSGIYFHCTAGKDRTGIVAAVILTVLKVNKKDILEDYLETNKHTVFPFSYKVFSLFLDKKTRSEFKGYISAKEEYLKAAFEEIDSTYGSMDGFLRECCSLDEEKIARLREKYIVRKP